MRRQEYIAVGILVALILSAWYFEAAKNKDREQARAVEQVQQTSAK